MRSKRFLAMLLALCLVLSAFSPVAFAVQTGEDTVSAAGTENEATESNKNVSSEKTNDLLVSSKDAKTSVLKTLRDENLLTPDVQTGNSQGNWEISAGITPEIDLLQTETPACLEDLKKAAELYSADEVVRAFVVMEDAPLAESYSSISLVSASLEKQMIEKQDSVIAAIERTVLNGEKLEVRYQFTYLTNAFSVETEFENLEKIAMLSGVKSVFVAPVYSPCETESVSNPNTAASGAMTGVDTVWADLGYTGEGMTIAVIDTGLDLDHPSFGALDEEMVHNNDNYLDQDDIAAVLEDLNAYGRRSTITPKTLYRSTKVPYAFNYCDNNLTADHSADYQGDHGTHVAGIAAANKVEGTSVVGMAPDAQIVVMKVFGANGGAYTDDIVAALEDAMTLGCDVVNASLGSPAGFSESGSDEIDAIYARLANQNIIACISAGNEGTSSYGNLWGTDLNRTNNPDNATIGSPALYANVFSVASAENNEVMTPYFALTDGTKVFFNQSYEYYMGYVYGMAQIIGWELEYVIIDGLGNEEDFYDAEGNSLVEGKVAVVKRGEINFGTKVINAEYAGAVGCVIWNANDTDDIFNFYMNTSVVDEYGNEFYPSIPCCLITLTDGQIMADAEVKTMTVSEEMAPRVCEGGQMSSFSSWGVSPDLRLVPDITGIGGNVYSCYDGGGYGIMSGTSMSSPQLAGISALVMQYLQDKYPEAANDGALADLAMALIMSTANPITDSNSGVEASPRQQGAGLVDAAEAVKTKAYLTVNGGRPKAELGDSTTGKYTFTFEINNISNEAETYTLSSSLLTEDFIDYGVGEYFMAGQDVELSGSVTFDAENNTVTVAPGETATVTVTITLSDADKALFARYWENGGYVEGYVYLENADEYGVDLNLPFLGFYGDWTQAPVFDTAYWYDNSFWGAGSGWPEGDEYYHVLWTSLAGTDWVLGFNPYSGPVVDGNYNIIYNEANNSVSPNGDGVVDGLEEIYLSLLRNAKSLTLTYTDAQTGEILDRQTSINNTKTMYFSSYGQVVPWLFTWQGELSMYDFTGADGKTLANNTKVLLTVDAYVDYGTGGTHTIEIPMTVDTEVPALLDAYQFQEEDGSYSLVVVASDNVNVAAIYLMNRSGSQIYGYDYCFESRDDGTYVATFNVDDLGTELMVAVCDYAGNEGYYNITYTEAGENTPDMTPYADQIFAYRVFDYDLYSDHMYGWVSMNKPASSDEMAAVSVWSDDYLEYAAINAAEYAGGKIFAVDAVYNLVVLEPGVWNRSTICNLGVNVLDMTFDDSTDTMYVLTKEDYYVSLQTLDLMTGALTMVADYGYYNYAPIMIADDDNGTIYAVKYSSGYSQNCLYTLDVDNEEQPYALVPVTDAEGNAFVLLDSTGANTAPQYSQSMTYSDGKLYWAYYKYSWNGGISEMIVIDVDALTTSSSSFVSWAYDADYNVVEYYPITEMVGLLTLTETQWQIPAATVLEELNLDAESLILTPGQTVSINAFATPWNYTLGELTWTSSDESVVTVVDGKVTAVNEGMAQITVTTEGVSTICNVLVVNTATTFNAYNYYSGDGYYGYMVEVDTGLMDYYLTAESPVDFLAADYNGHDGYYYGYSEGGQFWRYDMETGEAVKLGDPIGAAPADMAYDYSTGLMYAVMIDDANGYSSLCMVNLHNGQLEEVYQLWGYYMMTLACDMNGNLFSITADGMLVMLCEIYDDWFEEYIWAAQPIMMDLGYVQYMQSMCYDYANNVIIWANPETASLYWIDIYNGYVLSLGDHTGTGTFELVGMYTVPAEIPALAPVAVESVEAADMLMLTGSVKTPNITIAPLNATCQNVVWTSSDAGVVAVTGEGALKGVSEGTAVISGTLTDEVTGTVYELSFNVTVLPAADDIYGMVLTDIATYGGQYWVRLYPTDPGNPDILNSTDYVIYAEEYYDGKLYAFGYDPYDWSGSWQYFIMDPATYEVLEQYSMTDAFPFVYDMTYDYTTSTMYAVAGASDNASDLYAVNMETGELILVMQTEQFFMSLTASPDGTLYAMEQSQQIGDAWDLWAPVELVNAQLYTIDPVAGTVEWFADTGVTSSVLASMAYDYDTDYIYWTALDSSYAGGLCLIDPATGVATKLDSIGAAGAQVTGLYIISENFPEEGELSLMNVVLSANKTVVSVGNTTTVNAHTLPIQLDAQVQWTSADESVATVDENGVITGVAQGSTTVTATVTHNGVTASAECAVAVMDADAAFLTWNRTNMGWSAISRADYTVVNNYTQGEEIGVQAVASVDETVYGIDMNNQLFELNVEGFTRTVIGEEIGAAAIDTFMTNNGMDVETYPLELFQFEVRDMAYDVVNERMLVLGSVLMYEEWYGGYGEFGEMNGGNSIYEIDLTTGELTELYNFIEYYYVYGLTVDENGAVYFYNSYDDVVFKLDLESGAYTKVVSLQSQSMYGATGEDTRHAMYYDVLTDMLYLEHTSNNSYYQMAVIEPATGTLTNAGFIGEVLYDYDSWSYSGDCFSGLVFVDLPEIKDVEYVSISTTLNGEIGLNFYVKLSDRIVNDPSAYMEFTVKGESVQIPVSEAKVSVKDDVTRYCFTYELAAAEMTDVVTAQICNAEGTVGDSKSYTVQQYADYVIANFDNEELVALMEAMLNYGAYAQIHFGHNTDDLANAKLDDTTLPEASDLSAYAHSITGAANGLTVKSFSLLLQSETTLRIYFALDEGKSVEDYTLTVDGEPVTAVADGERYYVELTNIAAAELDEMHEFDLGGTVLTCGALSYVNQVQNYADAFGADVLDMVNALYVYYLAAEAYFG